MTTRHTNTTPHEASEVARKQEGTHAFYQLVGSLSSFVAIAGSLAFMASFMLL